MLCERCNQNNATLYVSEYKDGRSKNTYLCNECAKKQTNISGGTKPTFENFLMGVLEMALDKNMEPPRNRKPEITETTCSNCNMKLSQFRKNGRFGCSNCYQTFEAVLEGALKKIQPGNHHEGKVPKNLQPILEAKKETESYKKNLQLKLNLAVKEERYEDAAKLRDKIRELDKEGNSNE